MQQAVGGDTGAAVDRGFVHGFVGILEADVFSDDTNAHLVGGREALGDSREAMEHMRAAAGDDYAPTGGFMHTVARVHVSLQAPGR